MAPVILAGGGGTRLWPLSREYYPKQFLSINSEWSLLQETLLRLDGLEKTIEITPALVVCNEEHRFLVAEQIAAIRHDCLNIILEPEGRNTAPALTVSALQLLRDYDDIVMVMMPADHKIDSPAEFRQALQAAYQLACNDTIVTFGITPDRAETGYGYIHTGDALPDSTTPPAFRLQGFREKPGQADAEKYLAAGNYLWNSGIFMMKASVWNNAIRQTRPDIYQACVEAQENGRQDGSFFRLDKDAFLDCPADSIDYAVMEKLSGDQFKMAVIPLPSTWSDMGAWSAVWEKGKKDAGNNVTEGDVVLSDTGNSLVSAHHRLVTAVGCRDMVIVETADAVLVADKQRVQDVKNTVAELKAKNREESLLHRRVYRPWGSYETIDSGPKYQVKKLVVNPGRKLSLQSHGHRAEHWVVVTGTATVTRGDDVFELKKDESTYLPIGTRHRLENATSDILELIEVQTGDYLGEDDIIRYDDDFGRA